MPFLELPDGSACGRFTVYAAPKRHKPFNHTSEGSIHYLSTLVFLPPYRPVYCLLFALHIACRCRKMLLFGIFPPGFSQIGSFWVKSPDLVTISTFWKQWHKSPHARSQGAITFSDPCRMVAATILLSIFTFIQLLHIFFISKIDKNKAKISDFV